MPRDRHNSRTLVFCAKMREPRRAMHFEPQGTKVIAQQCAYGRQHLLFVSQRGSFVQIELAQARHAGADYLKIGGVE